MPEHLPFERARHLALALAGIELLERHAELLARRGRRQDLYQEADWNRLLGQVEAGDAVAGMAFVGLITTRYTAFMRHPWQIDTAARHVQEVVRVRGRARIWSAAAATGEEPYSLAMVLLDEFAPGAGDVPARILATDIDAGSLRVAEAGEYFRDTLTALKPGWRERYFQLGPSGRWGVTPGVRRLVEFRPLNLAQTEWPVTGSFDVIFCRNVLMYLEAGHRYSVLERMASLLAPDGLLLLDPAEHLGQASHWFTPGVRGIHARHRGLPASRRAAPAQSPCVS